MAPDIIIISMVMKSDLVKELARQPTGEQDLCAFQKQYQEKKIYYDPRHPYTWGLMQSLPYFSRGREQLYTIPGMPPSLINPPKGDAYAARNEYALGIDYEEMPPMFQISDTHYAATWLLDKRAPRIIPPVGGKRIEYRSIG